MRSIPVLLVCACLVVACGDQDFSPDIRSVQVDEKCQMFEKLNPRGTWTPFGTMVCSGDVGERGEVGEMGPEGIQGATGEKGEKGERGERGERGEKGDQGVQGIQGVAGRDGVDGTNGTNGVSVQGPQGLPGKDGESIVGPSGKDGQSCSVAETSTGAVVTCGSESVAVSNGLDGSNGKDGKDALPPAFAVCKIGKRWLGSFSDDKSGKNTRVADVTDLMVMTTDGSNTQVNVGKFCSKQ